MSLDTKFDELLLQKYRRLLFPAIGERITTGYNVYVDRPTREAPFVINYLHSDLDMDETGHPHRHKQELIELLRKSSDIQAGEQMVNSVVDRLAVYKIGEWDENPEGLKFYDIHGRRLLPEELVSYRGIIIAEGKQYELNISVGTEHDVKHVLDLFNKHVFKLKVNSRGECGEKNNPYAIFGAWETPLIVVTSQSGLKRQDFKSVSDLIIADGNHEISALVKRQRKKFEQFLLSKGLQFRRTKRYANRAFVDQYLDSED
jgi:hypothetical protein